MAKNTIYAILALGVLVYFCLNIQRNMLYYPSAFLPSQGSLSAYHMYFWPADAKNYRGFISPPQTSTAKGTIVIFHGNAGSAADRGYYVNALSPLGYRLILAEYPGYGGRKGALGEKTFAADAKETLRMASERFGGPIYILGESLGCGVAAAAVKGSPVKIDGILLITPWDTLLSVAREKIGWFPVRLLMRDTYDTAGNLKAYQGKIAVIGAEQDVVIPIHHAEALFRSLSEGQGPRKMFRIKGADHNDWPGMVDRNWWKEIAAYLEG